MCSKDLLSLFVDNFDSSLLSFLSVMLFLFFLQMHHHTGCVAIGRDILVAQITHHFLRIYFLEILPHLAFRRHF